MVRYRNSFFCITFILLAICLSGELLGMNKPTDDYPNDNNIRDCKITIYTEWDRGNDMACGYMKNIEQIIILFQNSSKQYNYVFHDGNDNTKNIMLDSADLGRRCSEMMDVLLSAGAHLIINENNLHTDVAKNLREWINIGRENLSNWLDTLNKKARERLLWCLVTRFTSELDNGDNVGAIAQRLSGAYLYHNNMNQWKEESAKNLPSLQVNPYNQKICDFFTYINVEMSLDIANLLKA